MPTVIITAARHAGRLACGLAPTWLAAIVLAFDALREMNAASSSQTGDLPDRACAACGETLDHVAWVMDPCRATDSGYHRA